MIRVLALVLTGAVALPAAPLIITTPIPVMGNVSVFGGGETNGGFTFDLQSAPGSADTLFANGQNANLNCSASMLGCGLFSGLIELDGIDFTVGTSGSAYIHLPGPNGSLGELTLFIPPFSNGNGQLLASVAIQGFATNVVVTTVPGCSIVQCGQTTTYDLVPNPPTVTPEPSALISVLLCSTILAAVRKRIVPPR